MTSATAATASDSTRVILNFDIFLSLLGATEPELFRVEPWSSPPIVPPVAGWVVATPFR
jgi:hypothetical protein